MSPLLATAGDRRIALICATFPIRIDLGNPSHVSGGEGGTAGPARPSKRYCAAQFFELRRAAIHAVAAHSRHLAGSMVSMCLAARRCHVNNDRRKCIPSAPDFTLVRRQPATAPWLRL